MNRITNRITGELGERARVAAEWTWGIADPTDMYGKAMAFFLWEGCLHLLQCCGKDEPTLARKLVRCKLWRAGSSAVFVAMASFFFF